MTKKLKLYIIDEQPYLVSLDEIQVGDKVVVTVNGQYPSIVDCQNETALNLIKNTKLKLTQGHKIFLGPDKIGLTQEQINLSKRKITAEEIIIVIEKFIEKWKPTPILDYLIKQNKFSLPL